MSVQIFTRLNHFFFPLDLRDTSPAEGPSRPPCEPPAIFFFLSGLGLPLFPYPLDEAVVQRRNAAL